MACSAIHIHQEDCSNHRRELEEVIKLIKYGHIPDRTDDEHTDDFRSVVVHSLIFTLRNQSIAIRMTITLKKAIFIITISIHFLSKLAKIDN